MLWHNEVPIFKYAKSGPDWLMAGKVSRLVMAIISKETREVVERWQFEISLESPNNGEDSKENQPEELVAALQSFSKLNSV